MKLKLLLGALFFSAISANAQTAKSSIDENFDSFTVSQTAGIPQNDWTKSGSGPLLYTSATGSDVSVVFYTLFSANTPIYLISPKIVAPDGTKSLQFATGLLSPGANISVEVGLVADPADMSTFTSLGSAVPITSTEQIIPYTVPASSSQYIAFRFIGGGTHIAAFIDDVKYNVSTLAVSDNVKSKDEVKFAVNTDNSALQFVTKKEPKNIQIYSAAGQKVAEGKLNNQKFDISELQTGVYYMLIENAEGSVTKSKFIKK